MKKVGTGKTMPNRLLAGLGRALSLSALLLTAYGLRPVALSAEVPVKFTYQGNLRQSGFLVNGQRSMVFRIYDSSTSVLPAALLWTSPAYNVNLSTGVFRATLEPVIADWQSGNLWLELEVAGNRMSPREELTSSPYAINSLMVSGKRYTTAAAAPVASAPGELWYDTSLKVVNFWNGVVWLPTSGAGLPGAHAATHAGNGSDPIVSLGTHTVAGYITVSSSVIAGWFIGDGSGLANLNASEITSGSLSGDRIGNVIVSTHIVDGSVTTAKLNQSGCISGQLLQWNGAQWSCGNPAAVVEFDPLSIHNQDTLQAGTTFYVSSGTVNNLNINNSLKVTGTALFKGVDTQNYSLAVGTGTAHQVVVSTSGAVGIGTENPAAKLDVTGSEGSGQYIAIFNSGSKVAAWLRNK